MSKKWMVLIIVAVLLIAFWQMGGLDFLLARTIFAPDYNPDSREEEMVEDGDQEEAEEPVVEEEVIESSEGEEEVMFSTEELTYEIEVIGEGLEIPWEILPLSDGSFLVTERPGRVLILDKGEIYGVQGVEHIGEGGLLGIEKSPDFDANNHIFLYYTYSEGNQILNRVSRFTLEEDTLVDETYILDRIPGSRFHNGGRIKFGPDQKLYVTTGDSQVPELSQDVDSLAGKILRLNADGSIPEDNPFEDSPVFAYGLRNPQGLAWHPVSGDLFASDHGPSSQDEVNRIIPGGNYGWPNVTCADGGSQYEDPVSCYSDFTLAPSGIAFLPWDNLDESPLFVAGLRGNMIMRVDVDDEGSFVRQEDLFRDYGRIRTVVYHEDSLYVATNNRDGRGVPGENDDLVLKVTPVFPSTE
ncbi:PQQ-dependent sugar dehydrogenase [Gudongella sp. DL1XJH-153]|uniref:PQQ-dependent sugar dehydrogenase n=1 Tax=Gudongella sp. DL1XJH-153 TaxID=3409804 RepID=UPI003BB664DA